MKTIFVLQTVIFLMVTLLCASASAQQKNLTCVLVSVDGIPGVWGQEIHITLDEANSQAKSDDRAHDDGNFHPARFTPTTVKWTGGIVNYSSAGRIIPFGPLSYDLSRTTGVLLQGIDQLDHHYKCEVAQQKF